jgi:hypothetical protein
VLKPLSSSKNDWRAINRAMAGTAFDHREAAANRHNLTPLLRGRELSADYWHPFKLYQVYSSPPDPDTDWLKFRVRAGRVLGTDAAGTDGKNANPDAEELQSADTSTFTTITAGEAAFWFWLEIAAGAGTVHSSADPTEDGWDTCPFPDEHHIPIARVDTLTHQADKVAVIRQYLRADLTSIGTGGGLGLVQATIAALHASYLECNPTSSPSTTIKVAKPNEFRGGSAFVVIQPYALGDTIYVASADFTGVTVDESDLKLIDANLCGRALALAFRYKDSSDCSVYETYIAMTTPVKV